MVERRVALGPGVDLQPQRDLAPGVVAEVDAMLLPCRIAVVLVDEFTLGVARSHLDAEGDAVAAACGFRPHRDPQGERDRLLLAEAQVVLGERAPRAAPPGRVDDERALAALIHPRRIRDPGL